MATILGSTALETRGLEGFSYFKYDMLRERLGSVHCASGTVSKEKVLVRPVGLGDRGHTPALTYPAVKPWTSPLASPCLSLLVCKTGIIIEPTSQGYCEK